MPRKKTYLTATDQFCGAGGSTSGAKAAGIEVTMALNHWKLAIETHNTNHPQTDHACTDVQACDPRRYPSTDILITSPECTNHSLAKGKKRKMLQQTQLFGKIDIKPEEERSRATMWDVPRFAEVHDYNIIIVENVVDARNWSLWTAWLLAMRKLGYRHKCLYLNSMFFQPCPQSRDRLFVVFWKKGNKAPDLDYRPPAPCPQCGEAEAYQWWKNSEKKWGKYKQQYLYRCSTCRQLVTPYYHAAFNIIDWSIPGTRIGDRKKPLAEKTMTRIRYGLEKYGKTPTIITGRYTSGKECRVRNAVSDVLPTQPGHSSHNLFTPFFLNSEHGKEDRVKDASQAIWTQTGAQATGYVLPFVCELNGTGKARSTDTHLSTVLAGGNHHMLVGNYSPGWARPLDRPAGTVTCHDHHGLFSMPAIIENYGQSKAKPATKALGTVTTNINHGILSDKNLQAFLSYYYGNSDMNTGMADPVNTMGTIDTAGLVETAPDIMDCYYRMLKAHEVQAAMAFDPDYVVLGNAKQKVAQLGNAVTPPVMEWIVRQVVKSLT